MFTFEIIHFYGNTINGKMNLQWSGGTAATLCESELSVIVIMSYLQGFTGKKKTW